MPDSRILLGVIGRPHGVRGHVHVTSYAEDLTAYGSLSDPKGRRFVLRWRGESVAEIAEIVDGVEVKVADRIVAGKLTNTRLFVDRSQLPDPEEDEYYLADLVGLIARNTADAALGTVTAVHDYGAGVSLEIARDHAPPLLVPFTRVCVPQVEVAAGLLVVVPPEEVDGTIPPPFAGGGWGEGAAAVLASPPPATPLPQGEGECRAGDGA